MTTRFPLFFVGMILCIPVACSEQQPRPDNLPAEKAQQTESLLANAESGTPEDKYNLGIRFERGTAVPQNYREAARWYRKIVDECPTSMQALASAEILASIEKTRPASKGQQ